MARGNAGCVCRKRIHRRQRVVESTLYEMARGRVEAQAPAVLVVGEVVAHRCVTPGLRLEEVRA